MPRKAPPRRTITSLSVTAALIVSGAALCTPASAADAPASAATAAVPRSTVASLQTSAGPTWVHRRSVVTLRGLPVLTKRPRAVTTAVAVPELTEAQRYVSEVLRLTNVQRAAHGLPILRADSCATRYAVSGNAVITRNAALSHQDLGVVLSGCAARGAGENLAFGNVSAAGMVDLWMGSPGHRANILNTTFTHIGIAATRTADGRWYGTQVFLRRYV